MSYRNDQDALRLRADQLDEDLAQTQDELALAEQEILERRRKDEQEAQEVDELQREVLRLRKLAGEDPPPSPGEQQDKQKIFSDVGTVVAVVIVAVVMVMAFVIGPDR